MPDLVLETPEPEPAFVDARPDVAAASSAALTRFSAFWRGLGAFAMTLAPPWVRESPGPVGESTSAREFCVDCQTKYVNETGSLL